MHSSIPLGALALMAGSAVAKIVQINVGESGLVFSPNTLTADVGDTLEFHFFSSFHTAVQGDYSTPCMRGSLENTGFSSGPIDNMSNGGVRLLSLLSHFPIPPIPPPNCPH
jgi:plastocyanin